MTTTPTLLSIQISMPETREFDGKDGRSREWTSGIHKQTVSGQIWLARLNLKGDGQADLTVHGGPDKAVMGYSADHYPFWRRKVPEYPFEYGAFGENFTLSGMTEDTVCIADVYQIGGVVIQVTTPRQPCWKLSRKVGNNQIGKLMIGTGYSGWYFSVVMEGFVEAGLPVRLVERSQPEWPVRRFNDDVVYA